MSQSPTRPLLRYHGGKWVLASWIVPHFPEHRIYVEPFGGAASVLLRKPRSYAEVYNDLDSEVVNLFRVVRDRGDELARAVELTAFSRDEYYAAIEVTEDPLESARRLVVRSFMGFGSDAHNPQTRSGFRAISYRSNTTGATDWRNYPTSLAGVVGRLRGVTIENRPAIQVMRCHDTLQTLHYCDPPYVHSTRMTNAHSPSCYAHEMTDADHAELAECLRGLQGMVIVSGYDCELYQDLYADWRTVERRALADGARERTETLWFSPNIPERPSLFGGCP